MLLVIGCAPQVITIAPDRTAAVDRPYTGRVHVFERVDGVPHPSTELGFVCVRARDLTNLPALMEAATEAAALLGANAVVRISQVDANAARPFIPGVGVTRVAGASTLSGFPILPPFVRDCYTTRAFLIVQAYWVPDLGRGG
jgi:hypothetical protein